jgi:lysophospholipase L1-like esterase
MANDAVLTSFVAIGDSFTEGLNDFAPDGSVLGWADRFAATLDAAQPGVRYANLAIRGRMLDQIVEEQVPVAVAARPSVIGFSAGGNDILRLGTDPDDVAARYAEAVATLRAVGSRVLVFTGFDVGTTPVLRLARGKIAIYNEHLRVIAARHGCDLVDLWSLDTLRDRRSFSEDRLHLSPDGHERVARLVARALGVSSGEPDEPWPDAEMPPVGRRDDLHWARDYFLPWVGRRVRHQSSGDGITPKRPELDILRRTGS